MKVRATIAVLCAIVILVPLGYQVSRMMSKTDTPTSSHKLLANVPLKMARAFYSTINEFNTPVMLPGALPFTVTGVEGKISKNHTETELFIQFMNKKSDRLLTETITNWGNEAVTPFFTQYKTIKLQNGNTAYWQSTKTENSLSWSNEIDLYTLETKNSPAKNSLDLNQMEFIANNMK
ncbi:hypothetical protein [Alicyclobacillus acidiphilus]|uniref:hypothetical protein n=1 Tax=Alicyclobacillus acidiphilus TaxID=182455 RepID=UPI000833D46D|nr:hypothetical protein [Alicyclobacillus acidiphilus]